MTGFKDEVVLITGGARGIGRLMAQRAVARGARVVLWDINAAALEATVAELGEAARGYVCDITDRAAVYRVADRVREEVGEVDILVNNAGIVTGKPFLELTDEMIERTFDVNALSLFWTARAFLPSMVRRDHGHVVTIASAAGQVGVAKLGDYCGSKFAAVGFDESLRVELRNSGSQVRTTVVCPYYINTGMFDGVQTRVPWLLPILEEDKVADRVIRAIEKNTQRLFLPGVVGLLSLGRILPTSWFDGLMNLLGVNVSMDQFHGHGSSASSATSGTGATSAGSQAGDAPEDRSAAE